MDMRGISGVSSGSDPSKVDFRKTLYVSEETSSAAQAAFARSQEMRRAELSLLPDRVSMFPDDPTAKKTGKFVKPAFYGKKTEGA